MDISLEHLVSEMIDDRYPFCIGSLAIRFFHLFIIVEWHILFRSDVLSILWVLSWFLVLNCGHLVPFYCAGIMLLCTVS